MGPGGGRKVLLLIGDLRGAAGGRSVSFGSGFDGGNGLKGVNLGVDGGAETIGLIAASFCCGAEIVGFFPSDIRDGSALLSWAVGPAVAGPNSGDVPNEKAEGAETAAGWSRILFGFRGTAASVEVGVFPATACVGSEPVAAGNVPEV